MTRKSMILMFCVVSLVAVVFFSGCTRPLSEPITSTRAIAEEALSKAEANANQHDEAAMNRANQAIRIAEDCCEDSERNAQAAKDAADRAEAAATRSERVFDKISGK